MCGRPAYGIHVDRAVIHRALAYESSGADSNQAG
jgi:hypothetical protein